MIFNKITIENAKRELRVLVKDIEREENISVNLPLYGIEWSDRLTYQEFVEKYKTTPLLSHQLPQCHICTRFGMDDNPLFAYACLEKPNDFKLIWRCVQGHRHDHGRVFLDIQTGMEVHC